MIPSCFSVVSFYERFLHYSISNAGLSSQTVDIDDETTIHFWGPKPNSSATPKPSLILIHGFGPQGVWQWRPQITCLARYFDLYVPDLIFFGGSTTKSLERSEGFQANCMGKLLERLGVDKYYVVGTSYGGLVAYCMASKWPERVEKVVIASSGVNMRWKDNQELLKRANIDKIEHLMLPATPSQLRTLMGLSVCRRLYMPEFLLNDFIDKLYAENRKEKLELLKGLTLGKDDTVNISPLQQEVLIVWGDKDQIFLFEKATELKELIGKKVKLEVIKNTSHVPQLEHPGAFNSVVKDFLLGSL